MIFNTWSCSCSITGLHRKCFCEQLEFLDDVLLNVFKLLTFFFSVDMVPFCFSSFQAFFLFCLHNLGSYEWRIAKRLKNLECLIGRKEQTEKGEQTNREPDRQTKTQTSHLREFWRGTESSKFELNASFCIFSLFFSFPIFLRVFFVPSIIALFILSQ